MDKTKAYATASPTSPLGPFELSRREVLWLVRNRLDTPADLALRVGRGCRECGGRTGSAEDLPGRLDGGRTHTLCSTR